MSHKNNKINKNNFQVGNWIWHETERKAFKIVERMPDESNGIYWKPNYISLEAANINVNTVKRLATAEEIDYYNLHPFCDNKVLIGQYRCYYFSNIWKELRGVNEIIVKYLQIKKQFCNLSILKSNTYEVENDFYCKPNGLKIGCMEISNDDIISMSILLNLKA